MGYLFKKSSHFDKFQDKTQVLVERKTRRHKPLIRLEYQNIHSALEDKGEEDNVCEDRGKQ